jgi:3-deoxy-manno-octulosonate cytidylyltransferase (CMP-KDO synthetase)
VMTSADCLTGTDRVAEVARHIHANTYINVQGDEPLFNPADLSALIGVAMENPSDVVNGYCPIFEEAAFRSPSVPKVVIRPDGRLLYMSRGAIPTDKKLGFAKAWRQVCAYAFPRAALESFSACTEKTALEEIEDIEILRFLELGWEVKMVQMSEASVAVDHPEDVEAVERLLRAQT